MSGAHKLAKAMTFQIGSLVRLNSGGPLMVVYDVDYWVNACCNWLAGTELRAATFPPTCLKDAGDRS